MILLTIVFFMIAASPSFFLLLAQPVCGPAAAACRTPERPRAQFASTALYIAALYVLAWLYTAPPYRLKYSGTRCAGQNQQAGASPSRRGTGLGELAIFVFFGPIMTTLAPLVQGPGGSRVAWRSAPGFRAHGRPAQI
jgi:hypothetical protein